MMCFDRPFEAVRTHAALLRSLPKVLHDFLWAHQADMWMTQDDTNVLADWLRNGRHIVSRLEDQTLFDLGHWHQMSEEKWGNSLMYGTIQQAYAETLPIVFERMRDISSLVGESAYFRAGEDDDYLASVQWTAIPEGHNWSTIHQFVEEHGIREPR